jgi:mannose-1-phosphate guanylyltransferase
MPEGLRPLAETPCLGSAWVHPQARVEAASVQGHAFVDAGAVVDATARLGDVVYVGRNVRVHARARLERAVVLEETEVAEGEVLRDVIAWKQHRIPAPL